MRILITTGLYPPEIGGPATYSKLMEEELPKQGIAVEVLPYARARKYPKFLSHLVYVFLILKLGRKADVVFAQDTVSVGFPSYIATRFLKATFIVRVTGDYAWEQSYQRFGVTDDIDAFQTKKYGWRVELLRSVQRLVVKKADAVIVPSEYLKTIVLGWFTAPPATLHVVHNTFQPTDQTYDRTTARAELELDGFVFLTASRLVPWKGQQVLVEAFASLQNTHPNAFLVIAGDGQERENIETAIAQHKLNNTVRMTGKLSKPELQKYITASDAFVLNTGYEGLSHQLLEVMHSGVPIVTTAVGGNPELITHNENGLLCAFNDKADLEKHMKTLMDSKELREQCVEQSKARLESFSKERVVGQLADVFKQYGKA